MQYIVRIIQVSTRKERVGEKRPTLDPNLVVRRVLAAPVILPVLLLLIQA